MGASKKTVLILGGPTDEHGAYVRDQLLERGADAFFFDIRDFPNHIRLTMNPGDGQGTIHFEDGPQLAFADIDAVYWRNYNRTRSQYKKPIQDYEMAHIAENDSRGLVESLLMGLETKWVNGWEAFQLHQRKPYALRLIAQLGVRIPRTLCSNNPDHLVAFQAKEKATIFKPIQGGTHTERLDPSALTEANLVNLELGPLTFQEEIPGTNIRAFVAGDRVLACEVKSRSLDFRDDPRPDIIPHDLPDAMQKQSVAIARRLSLLWTGIDYRLSESGEYVYLEANPSPMFMGFEHASGLPLTAALLDLLLT